MRVDRSLPHVGQIDSKMGTSPDIDGLVLADLKKLLVKPLARKKRAVAACWPRVCRQPVGARSMTSRARYKGMPRDWIPKPNTFNDDQSVAQKRVRPPT